MSGAAPSSILRKLDPVGGKVISKIGGGILDPLDAYGHKAEAAEKEAAAQAARLAAGGPGKRSEDRQIENRRDQRGAVAAATSTAALDSDYYLLGAGGPTPKRRGASRQLLGE